MRPTEHTDYYIGLAIYLIIVGFVGGVAAFFAIVVPSFFTLWLPCFAPPAIFWTAAAICFSYSRQPPPAHLCHCCGYDLRKNQSGVCPECGTGVEIDH